MSPAPTSVASLLPSVTSAVTTASTSPTATTSASPSFNSSPFPEPTVAVSGTPVAGDGSDRAVLAAARAYVTALDVGFRTGDERPFLTMTSVACDCRKLYLPRFARQVRERVTTTFRTQTTKAAIVQRSAREATVTLATMTPEFEVRYPDGRKTKGEAGVASLELVLRMVEDRWIVRIVR